jgi:hypothetical protein
MLWNTPDMGTLWKTPEGFINPDYMLISDHKWRFSHPVYVLHQNEKMAHKRGGPIVGYNDWVCIYLPPFKAGLNDAN